MHLVPRTSCLVPWLMLKRLWQCISKKNSAAGNQRSISTIKDKYGYLLGCLVKTPPHLHITQTHDRKVVGLNPRRSGGRIFFSWVNFMCWLLFWYLFHPCVIAEARKRSRSFCQKCRRQVTTKHTCTLCTWLWIKRHSKLVHDCMVVHRTFAETAALSCSTSYSHSFSGPAWKQRTAL